MGLKIKVRKYSAKEILCYLFLIFSFIPFLFPNPIVKTNIQPYAALIGTVILLFHFGTLFKTVQGRNLALILGSTFAVALVVTFALGASIEALRGAYNYFALFIIPCATVIVMDILDDFPEVLFKTMIILWFAVATIQFFVFRGFATELISSVRWSYRYRGVVGLASEPSFLGITCFYFLHFIRRFKTGKFLFSVLTLAMGVLYAQSTTGILFIVGFFAVFLLDEINTRRGLVVWIAAVAAVALFIYYVNTRPETNRLYQLYNAFFNGGVDSVLSDGSASIRYNAIGRALGNAARNWFIPSGFGARIGSAYGGMLVELGIFALPAILLISYGFSLTFNKMRSRVVYYIVITILLLNNTQIGNPLLLMVIGINFYYRLKAVKAKQYQAQDVAAESAEIYQSA